MIASWYLMHVARLGLCQAQAPRVDPVRHTIETFSFISFRFFLVCPHSPFFSVLVVS